MSAALFSPTNAAFEGFRVVRRQPRAVLAWAAATFIVNVVTALSVIMLIGDGLTRLEQMEQGGDPAQAFAILSRLAPLYAVSIPLGLAVIAVFCNAVYRAVLRPEDDRYGYLRLGGDELRLALLILVYMGLAVGLTFIVTLGAGLTAVIAGATVGPALAGLVGAIIGLGALCIFLFVGVRLSLAGPMTFAERKVRVFESWGLTRGHFWRLFGAYVLATAMTAVIVVIGLMIYAVTAAVLTGGDFARVGQVFQPDMTTLSGYFTPVMLIYLAFGAILGAVQNAVLYAPAASIYRSLHAASDKHPGEAGEGI